VERPCDHDVADEVDQVAEDDGDEESLMRENIGVALRA
jgi:hypothetical protein